MSPLAFKVEPLGGGWALSHGGQPIATFATREEAERAALAVAAKHPANRTAQVDLEQKGAPTSTVLVF
jgi:Uncharacterized protein conserved in bacteria (DUF2188)